MHLLGWVAVVCVAAGAATHWVIGVRWVRGYGDEWLSVATVPVGILLVLNGAVLIMILVGMVDPPMLVPTALALASAGVSVSAGVLWLVGYDRYHRGVSPRARASAAALSVRARVTRRYGIGVAMALGGVIVIVETLGSARLR